MCFQEEDSWTLSLLLCLLVWGQTGQKTITLHPSSAGACRPRARQRGGRAPAEVGDEFDLKRLGSAVRKRQPPHAAGAPGPECPPSAGLPRRRVELGYGRVAVLEVVKETLLKLLPTVH